MISVLFACFICAYGLKDKRPPETAGFFVGDFGVGLDRVARNAVLGVLVDVGMASCLGRRGMGDSGGCCWCGGVAWPYSAERSLWLAADAWSQG